MLITGRQTAYARITGFNQSALKEMSSLATDLAVRVEILK